MKINGSRVTGGVWIFFFLLSIIPIGGLYLILENTENNNYTTTGSKKKVSFIQPIMYTDKDISDIRNFKPIKMKFPDITQDAWNKLQKDK
jgi:hypothetical protein